MDFEFVFTKEISLFSTMFSRPGDAVVFGAVTDRILSFALAHFDFGKSLNFE